MLGCNQDITIWVREKANKTNKEKFVRNIIPVKCKWKNHTVRNLDGAGANIYNSVVIIIPYFDGILDLNIKEGDIAALGVRDDIEITGVSPNTASEVRQRLSPNITIINSVSCNFDESPLPPSTTLTPPSKREAKGAFMKGEHLRLTGN